MKTLFEFAVVRFMPFAETQEFANVGIVLWSSNPNTVLTKLAPAPFNRINNFFDDLDGKLYGNAREIMELELRRIKHYVMNSSMKEFDAVMSELTRQREGVMTYSEVGGILADNAEYVLNKLYATFIGRDLPLNKEQRERLMVNELKTMFMNLPFKYKEKPLDTGFGKIKVPLVTIIGHELRAIKPMAFNQVKPMDIVEHGDKWISRIGHALDAKSVEAENFLFTVESPRSKKEEIIMAYESVVKNMNRLGVNVIPFDNTSNIMDFAEPDILKNSDNFKLI